jgi:hypothetical protein
MYLDSHIIDCNVHVESCIVMLMYYANTNIHILVSCTSRKQYVVSGVKSNRPGLKIQ